jgi:hypothetical protein
MVGGAKLTSRSAATGETTTTTSSATGDFQLPLLKPGDYTLIVSRDNFKSLTRTVTVLLGQNSTLNLALELGTGTTVIEVTSGPALLQTEDANITTTFDTHTVQNIPNPGNDITYVAQTAPGVSMNTSSGNGYGNFSAFGLPGTANLFTINGNDYNDPFLNLNNSGASNLLLGTNDVQEVSVVSNGYTGQYGRQAGAQIDVSTKSGSNAFHGGANYYWTGQALDANDYFLNKSNQPRPFQNNNNWAADLGGPIKKDKVFFFVDTEGLRYIFATATQATLPTPAFQNYVLSQNPTETSFYQKIFGLYNGVKGIANAQPVANSCPGINVASLGGNCLETVTGSGSSGNSEWLLIGRVDYNLSDKDKISGRVKFDRGVQPTYADPINSAFNAISRQPSAAGRRPAQLHACFQPVRLQQLYLLRHLVFRDFPTQQSRAGLGRVSRNFVPRGYQHVLPRPNWRSLPEWLLVPARPQRRAMAIGGRPLHHPRPALFQNGREFPSR